MVGKPPLRGNAGHSLRRGGAQYLFNKGTPLEVIKVKGRWLSDAWRKYIHLNSSIDSDGPFVDPFAEF